MRRCFTLASKGGKNVKSNPQVGALIVHNDEIIGEGYHQKLGDPHAEVIAIRDVAPKHAHKLGESTMYISLEPCNHFGRTPPCVEAIKNAGINKVVISVLDPNPKMQGRSVEHLRIAGVDVKIDMLKLEGEKIIRKFRRTLTGQPFVTLKMAQSKDRIIGKKDRRILISGKESSLLTHKLRAEHDAVMVGTNTAIIDNPELTCRNYPGDDPLRIVLDRKSSIPKSHTILSDDRRTMIFTTDQDYRVQSLNKQVVYVEDWNLLNILHEMFILKIYSVLIEGGAKLLASIVKENIWDDAYIITANCVIGEGVKAPAIHGFLEKKFKIGKDEVHVVSN